MHNNITCWNYTRFAIVRKRCCAITYETNLQTRILLMGGTNIFFFLPNALLSPNDSRVSICRTRERSIRPPAAISLSIQY